MTLELAPTEDILAEVVRRRRPGQLIVGFAAETENRMENGRAKLLRKGADAIVVNDVAGDGVGIDADTNAATFLTRTTAIELPEMPKRQLADRILDEILTLRRPRSLVLEFDEHEDAQIDTQTAQDRVLSESVPVARSPPPRHRVSAAEWSKDCGISWRARSIPQPAKLSLSGCASIATWG